MVSVPEVRGQGGQWPGEGAEFQGQAGRDLGAGFLNPRILEATRGVGQGGEGPAPGSVGPGCEWAALSG